MMKKFNEDYFRGRGSGYKRGYEVIEKQVKTFIWPFVLKYVKPCPSMKVLDIGCAYGYLLRLFDDVGCETYGIDVSEYAIEQARRITKARLYVWDVDRGLPMFHDDFFDLVTMLHVIEHLCSPYNVLKEVHRVLRPEGKLVVSTPNLNAIARLLLKLIGREKEWYGFRDETHIYLFTPLSLRFLVKRCGFKVLAVEAPLMPLRKAPRIINKIVNGFNLGGTVFVIAEKRGNKCTC